MKKEYPWMRHKLCGKFVKPVVGPRYPDSDEISISCPSCGVTTVFSKTLSEHMLADQSTEQIIHRIIGVHFDRDLEKNPWGAMPDVMRQMLFRKHPGFVMKDWGDFTEFGERMAFLAGHEAALRAACTWVKPEVDLVAEHQHRRGLNRQRERGEDILRGLIDQFLRSVPEKEKREEW